MARAESLMFTLAGTSVCSHKSLNKKLANYPEQMGSLGGNRMTWLNTFAFLMVIAN